MTAAQPKPMEKPVHSDPREPSPAASYRDCETSATARVGEGGRKRAGKHGPTRSSWYAAKRRCRNEEDASYANYGGRGITFSPVWDDYNAFVRDMGERPEGMSIDRIDNDGNYEPGNCRWATRTEQARNTRSNALYDYQGQRLCVSEIAERAGVDAALLSSRLNKDWPLERALTEPANAHMDLQPYTRLQVAMRDFRFHRRELERQGLTADEIANRVIRRSERRSAT